MAEVRYAKVEQFEKGWIVELGAHDSEYESLRRVKSTDVYLDRDQAARVVSSWLFYVDIEFTRVIASKPSNRNLNRLQTFLYLLMRDELPTGIIAKVAKECSALTSRFSNGHLARHALDLARYLSGADESCEPAPWVLDGQEDPTAPYVGQLPTCDEALAMLKKHGA